MTRRHVRIDAGDARLSADRWDGPGRPVVLLHAGVADRRSWYATADALAGVGPLVAYDRRGFGETPPGAGPYRHVDDLVAVLDQTTGAPAWLVGSSMGGQVALDLAVTRPDRVAGLVLFAPAVSGAPEPGTLDAATLRLSDMLDVAVSAGDVAEINRLETWLWLDGPAGPEGRVAGPARELASAMNAVVLGNGVPESAGAAGVDAWALLGRVTAPAVVACGELDVPFFARQGEELAGRLPNARYEPLPGMAHLPYLERPKVVADLIRHAIAAHP